MLQVMKHFVGIDVGGTRLKAGLVDACHRVTNEQVMWLDDADKSEDGLLEKITQLLPKLIGGREVVLVGLGVAGVVHRWEGSVKRSPNFPAFSDFRIKERLEKRINQHVAVDNDANCVITGEYLQGAAAGKKNFIGLTLGTGVGGALMMGGHLWRGVNGMAGELGHTIVDPNGPRCPGTGAHGSLEMYPSVLGLRALCEKKAVDGVETGAPDLPKQLALAAESGDPTALSHFRAAGNGLGIALGSLLNVFDMKTVLLAGGVAPTFPLMEAACREAIGRVAFPEIADGLEILQGTLGEKAGVLGAAMQWMMAPHD